MDIEERKRRAKHEFESTANVLVQKVHDRSEELSESVLNTAQTLEPGVAALLRAEIQSTNHAVVEALARLQVLSTIVDAKPSGIPSAKAQLAKVSRELIASAASLTWLAEKQAETLDAADSG